MEFPEWQKNCKLSIKIQWKFKDIRLHFVKSGSVYGIFLYNNDLLLFCYWSVLCKGMCNLWFGSNNHADSFSIWVHSHWLRHIRFGFLHWQCECMGYTSVSVSVSVAVSKKRYESESVYASESDFGWSGKVLLDHPHQQSKYFGWSGRSSKTVYNMSLVLEGLPRPSTICL